MTLTPLNIVLGYTCVCVGVCLEKVLHMKKLLFFSVVSLFLVADGWAQNEFETRLKNFNLDEDYVAIGGYDPVAYFKYQEARKGKPEFSCSYQSVVYHFSSSETLELFKSNPKKYEPAYGGWCAYAMGKKGEKVNMNPETFKIQNGKLLLFYNRFFTNTLEDWEAENPDDLEKKADKSWQNITKKEKE